MNISMTHRPSFISEPEWSRAQMVLRSTLQYRPKSEMYDDFSDESAVGWAFSIPQQREWDLTMAELDAVGAALKADAKASGLVPTRPMKDPVKAALAEELARRSWPADFDHLRLSRGTLATPEGPVKLKKLGKGAFADVYRAEEPPRDVYAFTDDDVFDKEIAAMVHNDHPKNPHLPAVEKLGATADKTVYKMPHYKAPLKKDEAKPEDWADYTKTKKCLDQSKARQGYERNEQTLECTREKKVSPAVQQALDSLVHWASNYSSEYAFEFPAKNMATDEHGNIVFLDVVFDKETLGRRAREKWEKRQRLLHGARGF